MVRHLLHADGLAWCYTGSNDPQRLFLLSWLWLFLGRFHLPYCVDKEAKIKLRKGNEFAQDRTVNQTEQLKFSLMFSDSKPGTVFCHNNHPEEPSSDNALPCITSITGPSLHIKSNLNSCTRYTKPFILFSHPSFLLNPSPQAPPSFPFMIPLGWLLFQ